ncbi:ATP-dependent DNA helicase PIF1 [Trifolium repens]|nr:ATP-dependent DNA helicase PIF1 [Trifolium repens]
MEVLGTTIMQIFQMLIINYDDPIASIAESAYPNLLHNMSDGTYFQDRAILTLKNSVVDEINNYMLSLIPEEERTYLSFDSPHSTNSNVDGIDEVHTLEFLNTITTSGLPNHVLKLKVGVSNMLM